MSPFVHVLAIIADVRTSGYIFTYKEITFADNVIGLNRSDKWMRYDFFSPDLKWAHTAYHQTFERFKLNGHTTHTIIM